jgi:hypothetical protein
MKGVCMATGKTGERLLGVWASQAKMSYNPSLEEDKNGWDSILEFELENNSLPRDKTFNHIKCFIQVKTTKSANIQDDITLSNWENMLKNPLPFFILGIKLDENENPIELFLTHINEAWIGKIIKRLRENGNQKKLNKQTMSYKPNLSDKVEIISGHAIKERIIMEMKGSMNDYIFQKNQWLNTVGYEDYSGEVKFNIIGSKNDIIDFSIGLKKSIEVSQCSIKEDIRFGIPGNETSFDNGLIEINPPGIDVKVQFTNDYYNLVSFGKLFDPSNFLGKVPISDSKIKIETQFFDLILSEGQQFSINIKGDLRKVHRDLNSLYDYSKFILLLHGITENAKFIISLQDMELCMPIEEQVGNSIKDVLTDELTEFAQMMIETKFILNYFTLDITTDINIDELYQYRNYIKNINLVLDSRLHRNIQMRAKYKSSESEDNQLLSLIGDKVALPRVLFFKIDNKYLIISAIYYGKYKNDIEGYRLYNMAPKFYAQEILNKISEEIILKKEKKLFEQIDDGYFNLAQSSNIDEIE